MKHTKGDWKAVPCEGLAGWRISVENETHQICGIKPGISASSRLSKEQHIANARLIAEAPKLLAACQAAVYILRQDTPWAKELREQPWYAEAEKAIAKVDTE